MREVEETQVRHDPPPWATKNRIVLDLPTMALREFSKDSKDSKDSCIPILVLCPYAGHSSTIADFQPGQSLIETHSECRLLEHIRERLALRDAGDALL